ncbi:SDR family oxidoreductase [Actinomadura kijaniata]|uniref:NAD(P)-dependent dehydrogenase (Short-subunit alcohol dehydrogenase family) n=1 Tax=Actinomadura namibiensis TaxID=182080 RepID=A0A7W3QRW9_ACTNM|nr:SDR family NAD(P)-dependent oxidoreductase [Actinomadura namibiensis]MBA8957209.1 NAD(P)-dependent dehydrogenase (short-subunit alcohol dehydrogenase family) [Actinomadura namibiensis]
MDLQDKVVVVTGAGNGLGRAYALALAGAGAAVVVNDADDAAAKRVAEQIAAAGGRAVAEPGAVGPTEVAEALAARAVEEFGRLDVLVTNAGILRDRVLWKMSDDDFDAVVNVHLRGTFTCVRAAVARMREQGDGGRIIVVGSPAGQRGNFGQTNYSAAKAAIVGMVRTWAMECARANITVNAVVPVAATAMTKTIPAFAPHIQAWEERGEPFPAWLRAAEGFGTPEDVAALPVFLASDAAAGVTGQAIGIGGDRLSLWSHPQEVAVAYRDGGWDADAIAATWATGVGREPQTYGIPAPQAPEANGTPR